MIRERGRPRKENSKNVRMMIRMSSDDAYKLHIVSEKTGLNKSEIIRKALDTQYQIHKNRN